MEKQKLILTFDLEFWYNSKFLKKYLPQNKNQLENCVEKPTELLLDLLKKYNQRATFFVLGEVAEKYPELIKKISNLGHEIASHGYSHIPLYELAEKSLDTEIKLSKNILQNITNKEPRGFRAPNFSLNKKTKWALEILKKYNFQYDSSAHPLKFFKPSNKIPEIYPSLGGIYFKILPLWLFIVLVKILSKTKIPVLYFHPYELFKSSPQLKFAPWLKRKIKYWGTKNAWKKFEKLMEKFDFISIEEYLYENSSNKSSI